MKIWKLIRMRRTCPSGSLVYYIPSWVPVCSNLVWGKSSNCAHRLPLRFEMNEIILKGRTRASLPNFSRRIVNFDNFDSTNVIRFERRRILMDLYVMGAAQVQLPASLRGRVVVLSPRGMVLLRFPPRQKTTEHHYPRLQCIRKVGWSVCVFEEK